MRQLIKLTRSKYFTHDTPYSYRISDKLVEQANGKYENITEEAYLIGWSTEAEEGNQSVVGIVLLANKRVVAVQLSSIEFM